MLRPRSQQGNILVLLLAIIIGGFLIYLLMSYVVRFLRNPATEGEFIETSRPIDDFQEIDTGERRGLFDWFTRDSDTSMFDDTSGQPFSGSGGFEDGSPLMNGDDVFGGSDPDDIFGSGMGGDSTQDDTPDDTGSGSGSDSTYTPSPYDSESGVGLTPEPTIHGGEDDTLPSDQDTSVNDPKASTYDGGE